MLFFVLSAGWLLVRVHGGVVVSYDGGLVCRAQVTCVVSYACVCVFVVVVIVIVFVGVFVVVVAVAFCCRR